MVVVLYIERKDCSRRLYFIFFPDNSDIPATLGRRQIVEPHKYYLVRVIVFLWRVFPLFLFLTGWEFDLIPYNCDTILCSIYDAILGFISIYA